MKQFDENEIKNSKIIKQIPNYIDRFLPLLDYTHYNDNIIAEYDNIDTVTYCNTLRQEIVIVFDAYFYLLDSIEILNQHGVYFFNNTTAVHKYETFYQNKWWKINKYYNPILINFNNNTKSNDVYVLNMLFIKFINRMFKKENKIIIEMTKLLETVVKIPKLKEQAKLLLLNQSIDIYIDLTTMSSSTAS